MEYRSITVDERAAAGMRLDRYLSECLGILSRSQLKVRNLVAHCNGKPVKLSRRIKPGDRLDLSWEEFPPTDLVPEDLPLDILYEDDSVIVINKAQGMVVHPGAAHRQGTVANAILFRRHLKKGRDSSAHPERPGIVHRLDKDTTGVLIATYDDEALAFLAEQFKNRSTRKTYLALVQGAPPTSRGRIETYLARDPAYRQRFTWTLGRGKQAITLYRVLRSFNGYTLVVLYPRTGRTHQLRVHMKYLGCPILGDRLYGKGDPRFPELPLMLHAFRLTIRLPGEESPRTFVAPLPPVFKRALRRLYQGGEGKNG